MGANDDVTTREYVLARLERTELRACLYSDMAVGLSEEEERALKVTLFDLVADDLVYLRADRRGKKWVRLRALVALKVRSPEGAVADGAGAV